MPRSRVAWVTTQRFREPRLRELHFAPRRGARPAGARTDGIAWGDLGGAVVHAERLVVAVVQLESVAHFNPGHRAARSQMTGELRGRPLRLAEISAEGDDADQEPTLVDGLRMRRDVIPQDFHRFLLAMLVHEHRRTLGGRRLGPGTTGAACEGGK